MKLTPGKFFWGVVLLQWFANPAIGQPVPKIELRPAFPAVTFHLPVGMEEAPVGSGRFFVLELDGRFVFAKKGA